MNSKEELKASPKKHDDCKLTKTCFDKNIKYKKQIEDCR